MQWYKLHIVEDKQINKLAQMKKNDIVLITQMLFAAERSAELYIGRTGKIVGFRGELICVEMTDDKNTHGFFVDELKMIATSILNKPTK